MLKGGDFARKTVELPRRLKRLISVCTDCVMIPLALWTAISLKAGPPRSRICPTGPPSWRLLPSAIPIFIRAGLYRAVIRFLGHKADFCRGPVRGHQCRDLRHCGDAVSDSRAHLERCRDLFRRRAAVCRRIALCGALLPAAAIPHADRGARRDLRRGRSRRALIQPAVDHARI